MSEYYTGRATHQKERDELRARLRTAMHDHIGEDAPVDQAWFPYA